MREFFSVSEASACDTRLYSFTLTEPMVCVVPILNTLLYNFWFVYSYFLVLYNSNISTDKVIVKINHITSFGITISSIFGAIHDMTDLLTDLCRRALYCNMVYVLLVDRRFIKGMGIALARPPKWNLGLCHLRFHLCLFLSASHNGR